MKLVDINCFEKSISLRLTVAIIGTAVERRVDSKRAGEQKNNMLKLKQIILMMTYITVAMYT